MSSGAERLIPTKRMYDYESGIASSLDMSRVQAASKPLRGIAWRVWRVHPIQPAYRRINPNSLDSSRFSSRVEGGYSPCYLFIPTNKSNMHRVKQKLTCHQSSKQRRRPSREIPRLEASRGLDRWKRSGVRVATEDQRVHTIFAFRISHFASIASDK